MGPFEVFTKGGTRIVAQTMADAIALAKAMEEDGAKAERRARRAERRADEGVEMPPSARTARTSSTPSAAATASDGWTPPAGVSAYVSQLNTQQRGVLRAIATSRGPIIMADIAKAVGISDNRAMSVLMNRCRMLAKKAGLKWEDVVVFKIKGARANRTSVYWAGPLLREKGNPSAA